MLQLRRPHLSEKLDPVQPLRPPGREPAAGGPGPDRPALRGLRAPGARRGGAAGVAARRGAPWTAFLEIYREYAGGVARVRAADMRQADSRVPQGGGGGARGAGGSGRPGDDDRRARSAASTPRRRIWTGSTVASGPSKARRPCARRRRSEPGRSGPPSSGAGPRPTAGPRSGTRTLASGGGRRRRPPRGGPRRRGPPRARLRRRRGRRPARSIWKRCTGCGPNGPPGSPGKRPRAFAPSPTPGAGR